ncbi:MAG: Tn3 family transposase [Boseongicola sp. SB0664_bin_43]|uniref:Tn3 family transposase n=1 Tax=Boseongicola sp. SB0664_bin_43 TaxID=2604844 RepID=A0A6B0Y421_9RHOB|nr:Tn3 family transposase [Boseongicola sp. SB0664_bin_43]MYK31110.1 Tn3 family transposase [Boseongicola sp. SB0670_bin_30]
MCATWSAAFTPPAPARVHRGHVRADAAAGPFFRPHIKGNCKLTLYIFRQKGRAEGSRCIKPQKTSKDALVRENRDGPLRLAATIKLKENTASDIFRRLNSCSRQHALCQTLKSFGQIVKSLFIWRYEDDLDLRRAIERQHGRRCEARLLCVKRHSTRPSLPLPWPACPRIPTTTGGERDREMSRARASSHPPAQHPPCGRDGRDQVQPGQEELP